MTQSLLLHFNGASGATTTVDSSANNHALTLNGGASLSSLDPKFGATSLSSDGINDYLSTPAHTAFDLGSGDWTISFTVKRVTANEAGGLFGLETDINNKFTISMFSAGDIILHNILGGASWWISAGQIPVNVKTHIEFARLGNEIYAFRDGVLQSQKTRTEGVVAGASLTIAKASYVDSVPHYLNGLLDEFRLLKNQAAHTASFAPSSRPDAPPTLAWRTNKQATRLGVLVNTTNSQPIIFLTNASRTNRQSTPIGIFVGKTNAQPILFTSNASRTNRQSCAIKVGWQINQLWSIRLGRQNRQTILYLVARQNSQSCVILTQVKITSAQPCVIELYARAKAANRQSCTVKVGRQNSQTCTINSAVKRTNSQPILFTLSVSRTVRQTCEIKLYNRAKTTNRQIYSLVSAPSINITDQPFILLAGKKTGITSADLSQGEGAYAWIATLGLSNPSDYLRFAVDDVFILNLAGEQFSLIVDNKSVTRAGGQAPQMSLTAISPTARHAFPRALPLTKTWGATQAKAAAIEAVGETIDWQIVDWMIPAGRLAVTGAAPISVVQAIANSAGGVVETKPDGSLLVRPRFPVSVPDWKITAPDQVYTDAGDNLSSQEMYRSIEKFNKVLIRDFASTAGSKNDVVEYNANENNGHRGALSIYASPYRQIDVAHTGHSAVGLSFTGEVVQEKKELVEFIEGVATVQYPVYQIVTVQYQYANLGAVTSVVDSPDLVTTTPGYSMAWITYKTRVFTYSVSDAINETIQFLVMERNG